MEASAFEEQTLSELEQLNNPDLIKQYHTALAGMGDSSIERKVIDEYYGESIAGIYRRIEKERYEFMANNMSEILFPGEAMIVYPGIKNPIAKQMITCDFSGARINPGSLYVTYRPLVKNINNGNAYVLTRTLHVETGYEWNLPTTIAGLDALNEKIRCAEYYDREDGIDYTHLSQCIGGELVFKKLKRRKRYEIRICK